MGGGGSCTTSSDGLSSCGGGGAQPFRVYEREVCFVSLNLSGPDPARTHPQPFERLQYASTTPYCTVCRLVQCHQVWRLQKNAASVDWEPALCLWPCSQESMLCLWEPDSDLLKGWTASWEWLQTQWYSLPRKSAHGCVEHELTSSWQRSQSSPRSGLFIASKEWTWVYWEDRPTVVSEQGGTAVAVSLHMGVLSMNWQLNERMTWQLPVLTSLMALPQITWQLLVLTSLMALPQMTWQLLVLTSLMALPQMTWQLPVLVSLMGLSQTTGGGYFHSK